jgi:hypothetical protein
LAGLAVLGLAWPVVMPGPAAKLAGFLLAAGAGIWLTLMQCYGTNIVAISILPEGLSIENRAGKHRVAWEAVRRIQNLSAFRIVEIVTYNARFRLPYSLPDFEILVEQLLRGVARWTEPPARLRIRNSFAATAMGIAGLLAVPASVYFFQGILLLAWGFALWGALLLIWAPHAIVLTPHFIEIQRPLRRRRIPLSSIQRTALRFRESRARGGLAIDVVLHTGEQEQIDVDARHVLPAYALLGVTLQRLEARRIPA